MENIFATYSKLQCVIEYEIDQDPYKELLKVQGPLIDFIEPIPFWVIVCAKWLNISATFIWNYSDIFITTISISLSTQFKLFNAEVNRRKGEVIYI